MTHFDTVRNQEQNRDRIFAEDSLVVPLCSELLTTIKHFKLEPDRDRLLHYEIATGTGW